MLHILTIAIAAQAATLTVDRYGSADHTTIQAAIDAAQDGDTISVLPATYFESINFLGKAIDVVSTSGATATKINGLGNTTNGVTFSTGETALSILDGFSIENGAKRGIYIYGTSPTLRNLTLENLGSQSFDGSGIYIDAGSPSLESVILKDNTAYYGGGVYVVHQGNPTFTGCTLENNYAAYGGGIYLLSGSLTMLSSSFFRNHTYHNGGGIYAGATTTVMLDTTDFLDNWGYYTHGAALYVAESTLLFVAGGTWSGNYPFYSNQGYNGGAIYLSSFAAAQIQNAVFEGNQASQGGALYAYNENDLALSGNTWTNNEARSGGAILLNDNSTLTADGETFRDNVSYYNGGDLAALTRFDVSISNSQFENSIASLGHGGALYLEGQGSVALDGITILDTYAFDNGGGIYVAGLLDTVVLDNSSISGAEAAYGSGGAICLEDETDLLSYYTTLAGNTAYLNGGGISSTEKGSVDVSGGDLTGNTASYGDGGAIYQDPDGPGTDDLRVVDSQITDNTVFANGAGIYTKTVETVTLTDNHFEGNIGVAHNSSGGGFYAESTEDLVVSNNMFCNNTADNGAGAYAKDTYGGSNSDFWTNNVFQENEARKKGGGLYLKDSDDTEFVNNHVVGNTAVSKGGGIYLTNGVTNFNNNLFAWTQNKAAVRGEGNTTSSATFSYNAWHDNDKDAEGEFDSSDVAATGSISVDPLLANYNLDGDCDNDDLLPSSSSPLVDAGDPSILDFDGSNSDIGAYGGPGSSYVDADQDGYFTNSDCDDTDAAVHPGATEIPYNGLDDDCDASTLDDDLDQDGWDSSGDCDDADASVNPDQAETWYDGVDSDCDGASDFDADLDGYDSDFHGGADCNDSDAAIHPGASETWYDGLDSDCDGASDDDADGDGYDADSQGGADCDDTDATVHPGRPETWYDGVDSNCDGASDDDADGDGYDARAQGGADCDDTDDAVHPGASETWYDGVDTDCDGASDFDADGDGHDSDLFGGGDCNDADAAIYPGVPEADPFDGIDSNCDESDEYDGDGDGYASSQYGGDDCDDANSEIHPGAEETWYDGVDSDCAGDDDYDADGDGHTTNDGYDGDDCDDTDPDIHPGAEDTWYDGVDSDCEGNDDFDADGDGATNAEHGGEDCDDSDPAVVTSCEDTDSTGDTDWPETIRAKDGGNCGCSAQGTSPAGAWLLAMAGISILRRRRRTA
jgi:MYXO-CTERM domain-containing protein